MESPPANRSALDSGGPAVSERERQYVGRGATATGVTPAVVTDNEDPEGMGRVKLRIPRREGDDESDWARIAVPMAGGDRGTYFLPEVGDEVLVAFDASDPGEPYVVGALWNGEDAPPAANEGSNDVRLIKSRSGHEIELDDASDGGLRIETAGGHTVVLDDGGGTVTVEDGNGTNSVTFESGGLTLSSSTAVSVEAPQIDITSDGNLTVEAGGVLTLNGTLVTIN
nr:phage baseplate assembly protein V [Salinirubrum litoreum]